MKCVAHGNQSNAFPLSLLLFSSQLVATRTPQCVVLFFLNSIQASVNSWFFLWQGTNSSSSVISHPATKVTYNNQEKFQRQLSWLLLPFWRTICQRQWLWRRYKLQALHLDHLCWELWMWFRVNSTESPSRLRLSPLWLCLYEKERGLSKFIKILAIMSCHDFIFRCQHYFPPWKIKRITNMFMTLFYDIMFK